MSSPLKPFFSFILVILSSAFTGATCTTFSPISDTTFQPLQNNTNDYLEFVPAGVNQTFNPYMTNTTNIIISDGVTCPGSSAEPCYIGDRNANARPTGNNYTFIPQLIGGLVADNSTLRFLNNNNGTNVFSADTAYIPNDVSVNLFSLVMKASNLSFHLALLDNQTSTVAFAIAPGTSGYANFAAWHYCIAGIVSGCSGIGYPANGTPLEACTPMTLNNQNVCDYKKSTTCLLGFQSWVNTSEVEAEAVSCWPCEYEKLQPTATTTAGGVKPTNAASRESGLNVLRTGVVALAVAVGELLM